MKRRARNEWMSADGVPCSDENTKRLERRIGRLSNAKIDALDDALRFALQLR